ncbi:hypothetical protein TNCV_3445441 [Trichonephila clavipes]|nr:hypothetical protein TNCV_3445441 [Trichonephila clavipes]
MFCMFPPVRAGIKNTSEVGGRITDLHSLSPELEIGACFNPPWTPTREAVRQSTSRNQARRLPRVDPGYNTKALGQNETHEIHRGKGLEVRLSLAFSTIQVTVRISSAKFPEGTTDGDTTYLHLHNFGMELKGGEKYSPVPCTGDSAYKTFGSTDLTSTYSVCTRRVFGGTGIKPWPSGLEFGALTTRLPTVDH